MTAIFRKDEAGFAVSQALAHATSSSASWYTDMQNGSLEIGRAPNRDFIQNIPRLLWNKYKIKRDLSIKISFHSSNIDIQKQTEKPISGEYHYGKGIFLQDNTEDFKLEFDIPKNAKFPEESDFLIIQILDFNKNDKLMESLITLKNYDTESENYLNQVPLYKKDNNEEGCDVYLKSYLKNKEQDTNTLVIEILKIERLAEVDENMESNESNYMDLINRPFVVFFIWILWVLIGSAIIYSCEYHRKRKNYFDWIYFGVTTAITVGYGDLYPQSPAGKLCNTFIILINTLLLGWIVGLFFDNILSMKEQSEEETQTNLKKQQKLEEENLNKYKKESRRTLAIYGGLIFGLMLLGTLILKYQEGFNWAESFSWNFVTMSTVGYGDITTKTNMGKGFCIFYMLIGVYLLAGFASNLSDYYTKINQMKLQKEKLEKLQMSPDDLLNFDTDKDEGIGKYEFLVGILLHLEKTDKKTIESIESKFEQISNNGKYIKSSSLKKYEH